MAHMTADYPRVRQAARMLFSEGAYHIPQQEREKERMEERDSVSSARHPFALWEMGQKILQPHTLRVKLLDCQALIFLSEC